VGATGIPLSRVSAVLVGNGADGDRLIVLGIRLPRLIMGLMVGAALAISGALMQGLFRNPLADPGLVGVSAGAALAAALTIACGGAFIALPFSAFAGALTVTLALYLIGTQRGRTSIATMLLAGVAFSALASAVIGLVSYLSDDRQLRDLALWSLGSLSGATWSKTGVLCLMVIPAILATPFLARGLNALALGEAEAFHVGVAVQRVKASVIVLVAIAVGAAVACSGIISFVGIVVPHVVRLSIGPDHRLLLPASAILGAALMVAADMVARTAAAPAEVPIGILTAAIGAPFFLWLLFQNRSQTPL
jgi:iron complex transport system permease protein